jgi:hypothetical protein
VRAGFLVAALAAIMAALFGAFAERPGADPFDSVSSEGVLDAFLRPVERNAFRRLPVVSSTTAINHSTWIPGTEEVWAVGRDGLILRSSDAGVTWERRAVDWVRIREIEDGKGTGSPQGPGTAPPGAADRAQPDALGDGQDAAPRQPAGTQAPTERPLRSIGSFLPIRGEAGSRGMPGRSSSRPTADARGPRRHVHGASQARAVWDGSRCRQTAAR